MSRPDGSAVAASSTTISPPRKGSVVPAERAEAKKRSSSDREVALVEEVAHDGADLAGRADDADPHAMLLPSALAHRPVPPYTTASSSAPRSNAVVHRADGVVDLGVAADARRCGSRRC